MLLSYPVLFTHLSHSFYDELIVDQGYTLLIFVFLTHAIMSDAIVVANFDETVNND